MDISLHKRKHGFQRPLDKLQFLGWFFAILMTVSYGFLIAPMIHYPYNTVLHSVYGSLTVFCVILYFYLEFSNPQDNGLDHSPVPPTSYGQEQMNPEVHYCHFCKAYVNNTSKHCKICNKCVVGFDHHCKWLNNCIGEKNYKAFFLFLISLLLVDLLHTIVGVWLISRFIIWPDDYQNLGEKRYASKIPVLAHLIMLVIATIIMIIPLFLMIHLLGFHIMLGYKGKTTFEWIIEKKQRKEEMMDHQVKTKNLLCNCFCFARSTTKVYGEQAKVTNRKKRKNSYLVDFHWGISPTETPGN